MSLLPRSILAASLATLLQTDASAQVPESPPFPTNGLVRYYSFDETQGTIINELVSGRYNLFIQSSPLHIEGKINGALSFNGVNTYALANGTANDLPAGSSPRTIAFWINHRDMGTGTYPVTYGNGDYNQYFGTRVDFAGGGTIGFHGWGENNDFDSPPIFPQNNWGHVTYIYENNTVKIYLNSLLRKTASIPLNTRLHEPLTVGARGIYGFTDRFCNAEIDELGIWNRALNDVEIEALFNNWQGISYSSIASNIFNTSILVGTPIRSIPQLNLQVHVPTRRMFSLQKTHSLEDTNWQDVIHCLPPSSGVTTFSIPKPESNTFYRIIPTK